MRASRIVVVGTAVVLAIGVVGAVVLRGEVGLGNGRSDNPPSQSLTENGIDAIVRSDEYLDESWLESNRKSPHPEGMTQAYELMQSPPDRWSTNMQAALAAFIGNQPEVRKRSTRGWIAANVVCRPRVCMIELKENQSDATQSFKNIERIKVALSKQAWMLQLKPLYESKMAWRGAAQYLRLYEKVDVVSKSDQL
jgi:hypothetical protein